jgi:hypothetical protein
MAGHRAWALAVLLVISAGCKDATGRRQFFPQPSPLPPAGTLLVEGPSSMAPGSSVQFTATLVDAAGARRDVTREALWTVRGVGISVHAGLVVAGGEGFATIFASYGSAYTETAVVAVAPGTYVVRGRVTPLLIPAPGHVEIVDGPYAGRRMTANPVGEYFLVGVAGPMRIRASLLGHRTEERSISVDTHIVENFELQAPAVGDITGPWTLVVTPAAACGLGARIGTVSIEVTREIGFSYRIAVGSHPDRSPLRATLYSSVIEAELNWGDLLDDYISVRLSNDFEIAGRAVGGVSGQYITGTIEGTVFDTRAVPAARCYDAHPFEMRRP